MRRRRCGGVGVGGGVDEVERGGIWSCKKEEIGGAELPKKRQRIEMWRRRRR